jgi:hypothetical protein
VARSLLPAPGQPTAEPPEHRADRPRERRERPVRARRPQIRPKIARCDRRNGPRLDLVNHNLHTGVLKRLSRRGCRPNQPSRHPQDGPIPSGPGRTLSMAVESAVPMATTGFALVSHIHRRWPPSGGLRRSRGRSVRPGRQSRRRECECRHRLTTDPARGAGDRSPTFSTDAAPVAVRSTRPFGRAINGGKPSLLCGTTANGSCLRHRCRGKLRCSR